MRLALSFLIAGSLLLSAGAWLVYRPAGFMTAGVLAVAVGVLLIEVDRRTK